MVDELPQLFAPGPEPEEAEPEPEPEPEPSSEPEAEPKQTPTEAAGDGAFAAGQLVLVSGLVGAKHHNDKRGVVRKFLPTKGRYEIQLSDETAKIIAVKPGNLKPSTDYRDRDIVSVRGSDLHLK